jgi:hypothetical protein
VTPPKRAVEDEEERLARAALERTLIQRGGLLLPQWTLEAEPSFSYFHSSTDTISIDAFTILPFLAIGQIVSERVHRDTFVPALTLRLGLPWDFQIETRVPYLYQSEQTIRADNEERTREGHALGDVEVAISKQLLRARGIVPDLLGSIRWKSTTGNGPFDVRSDELPTGTGFHGLQGSLTAVKSLDPLAFFGGVAYTANLPADTPAGRIDPGDTWGFNLGLALALNLETSISLALEERFTNKTTQSGVGLPGTELNVGIFRVGASYVLAPGMSLDVGVGIGLTRDAPDLQLTVALPIRFPR